MKLSTILQITVLVTLAVFGAYQSTGEAVAQAQDCAQADDCQR